MALSLSSRSPYFVLLCTLTLTDAMGCRKSNTKTPRPPQAPASKAQVQTHAYEDQTPIRISRHRSDSLTSEVPELPQGADALPELTVEFTSQNGIKRIVSRSKNRVHIAMPQAKQEWLFVRNPIDGRRVSGILIDHPHQVLLDYPETDLRIEGIARGWADVINFDPSQGKTLQQGVDPKLIENPEMRYPNYGTFDIADWREELHENGHNHASHQPSRSKHQGPEGSHGHEH